jgi:hypothetical protein
MARWRADTKPILVLADGSYFEAQAAKQHLLGSQWGMMNETGNYPGQAWLWLYTFWYQIPPFSTSSNADAQIWAITALLSLGLIAIPFHPRRTLDPTLPTPLPPDLARLLPRRRARQTSPTTSPPCWGPPSRRGRRRRGSPRS